TQCGFKLLDGEIARALFRDMVTDGFAFDVELLWLAQRRGYAIREVGVRWIDDPDSRVRPLVDAAAMALELLRFRVHHAGSRAPESASLPRSSKGMDHAEI
ncbi:MAG: glycosyltransferase family 2 protein, partial [Acidobacteriota bacterium]